MTANPELFNEARLAGVLSDFARTMVSNFPIQALLDQLVARIVEILPIDSAGVTLISANMAPHHVSASDPDALCYEKLQAELSEGPCLLAYTSNVAVQVPDVAVDTRFPRFSGRAFDGGLRAVFTFPLRHNDHQLGALDLYRQSAGSLLPAVLTTAQTLADVAAAYIINAQTRVDLQDASDRSREQALHDGLTGLPNRTLMMERLNHAFQRSRRTGKTLSGVVRRPGRVQGGQRHLWSRGG